MLIVESRLCDCGLVTVRSFQFFITFKKFPNKSLLKDFYV